MIKQTIVLLALLVWPASASSQKPEELVSLDPVAGVIHFFPKKQKAAKVSHYQLPGKPVWIDAIRVNGKTQQIRISALPESREIKTLVKFKYPFGDASVTWNMAVEREGDIVSVHVPWNGTLIGERMDANEGGAESEALRKKLGVTGLALSGLPVLYSSGDSISLCYWPYLEDELWRDINVYYQRELFKDMPETQSPNNGVASNAYSSLEKAYKNKNFKPDYILINFGLHMINGYQNNLEGYGNWVQKFIDLAKTHDAKLIWVTTTPYGSYRADKNKTIQKFNETAANIVNKNNMYLADLYTCVSDLVNARHESNVYVDGVHFNDEVRIKQAEFLAQCILKIASEASVKKLPVPKK